VAHAQGLDYEIVDGTVVTGAKRYEANNADEYCGCEFDEVYSPSTDWAQGGAIIEREKINVSMSATAPWMGFMYDGTEMVWLCDGPTPLIAAMRCYVASVLGDEVELPEELEVTA
jgi:hypothetical protein